MTVIFPQDIATKLGVSVSWVYGHSADLGASLIGGKLIFTQEGLEDAYEKGKELARARQGKRADIHAGRIQHETKSRRLGKRQEKGTSVRDRARGLGLAVAER